MTLILVAICIAVACVMVFLSVKRGRNRGELERHSLSADQSPAIPSNTAADLPLILAKEKSARTGERVFYPNMRPSESLYTIFTQAKTPRKNL